MGTTTKVFLVLSLTFGVIAIVGWVFSMTTEDFNILIPITANVLQGLFLGLMYQD